MPFNLILTNAGLAAAANAIATNTAIGITQMKVGDGNGSIITPVATMTALVNTRWSGDISSLSAHGANKWHCNAIIPVASGGYTIREVGLFNAGGTMLAVGQFQATEKPLPSTGAASELEINVVFEITNGAAVSVIINPNVAGTLPAGGTPPAYLRKSGTAYGQSEWQDILPASPTEVAAGVTPLVSNQAGLIRSLPPEVGKVLIPEISNGVPKWALKDLREAASPIIALAQAHGFDEAPVATIVIPNGVRALVLVDGIGNTYYKGLFYTTMERNGVKVDLEYRNVSWANGSSVGGYVGSHRSGQDAFATSNIGMVALTGDGNPISFSMRCDGDPFQHDNWMRVIALQRPFEL